ncbi:MAG: hypothetical protein HY695_37895 [Deltaproteobacteria bacterium]|nr:hypothetical protein [Deltaproteobacteria bacterium]
MATELSQCKPLVIRVTEWNYAFLIGGSTERRQFEWKGIVTHPENGFGGIAVKGSVYAYPASGDPFKDSAVPVESILKGEQGDVGLFLSRDGSYSRLNVGTCQ